MLSLYVYLADQNPHRDRSLGISEMTKSLLLELAKREDIQLTTLTSSSSLQMEHERISSRTLPWQTDHPLLRLLTDHLHPLTTKPQSLWYYPKGFPGLLPHWPSTRIVSTIHDTILQHYADVYPESRSSRAFAYWIGMLKLSFYRSTRILTISNHAHQQIAQFANRYSLPLPPVDVVWEGSHWESLLTEPSEPKEDYLVHVASSAPHKRTLWLLRWWKRWASELNLPQLLLVGGLCEESQILVEALQGSVSKLPYQSGKKFQQLIGRARALIFPSEIEGFGLPALEAYYAGTPVCYVKGTAVAEVMEVTGGRGSFDLESPESLQNALEDVLSMSPEEVSAIQEQLYERFSIRQWSERVVASFYKTLEQSA